MKKIILIGTVLLVSLACQGQTAKSYTKSKTSGATTHSSVSVSVSDSNEIYSYSAIFDKPYTKDAVKEIEKVFGKPKTEGKNFVWREGEDLEIKAREGKISMEFEKGSTALYEKVKNLGEAISAIVGEKE
ncbi:hypothetical protein HX001_09925 [Empedobacter brevis]|uniref:Lipoprotein n=1 Tax=Empedobacter brevis TaxID=247 RepID=A0AAJ1QEX4_9FLAO|nr:hypothetical protein [Empedobacter brevis]MDM1072810.1 hypothetical protein [Empedobacter brevis]QHC84580.1 hypothetical protein AS589_07135 [Empedobacter brevis]